MTRSNVKGATVTSGIVKVKLRQLGAREIARFADFTVFSVPGSHAVIQVWEGLIDKDKAERLFKQAAAR